MLLFGREHVRLLHAGPQMLSVSIRNMYWLTRGRDIARKVVHKCIKCYKVKPTVAGPILVRDRNGRGCKLIKS